MYLTGKDVRQKETFNLNWFFISGRKKRHRGIRIPPATDR